MKTILFFCDIIGTFDSAINTNRKLSLKTFFNVLNDFSKQNCAIIKLSFVSSETAEIVLPFVIEASNFIKENGLLNITLTNSFADSTLIDRSHILSSCNIKDKTNQIIRQSFAEQQYYILETIDNILKTSRSLSPSAKSKILQRRKLIQSQLETLFIDYNAKISFIENCQIGQIIYADDCTFNLTLTKAMANEIKNMPKMVFLNPLAHYEQIENLPTVTNIDATTVALKHYLNKRLSF